MKATAWLFCYFLLFLSASAQNNPEPVKVTDLLHIKTVRDIKLTRDGSRAAFVLSTIEPDERNKQEYRYATQLYTLATNGNAQPVQVTFSRDRASQPAWSPDGRQLAFVRLVDGKPQIFILPMSGGEAWQLTRFSFGAANPKWSPDGKKIVFGSSITYKDLLKDTLLNPAAAMPIWPSSSLAFQRAEQNKAIKANTQP
jgi:dipeptidyl aminopeptidase/acylaminoacyl peptidase